MLLHILLYLDFIDLVVPHPSACDQHVQIAPGISVTRSILIQTAKAFWLLLKIVVILCVMNSHNAFFVYQNF